MRTRLRLAFAVLLFTAQSNFANSQQSVALDSYTCKQFLSDVSEPTDGSKVLQSLMMVAWASGYAAAFHQEHPRADPAAVRMIAATLGRACREDAEQTAIAAIAGAVKKLAAAPPTSVAASPSAGSSSIRPSSGGTLWTLDDSVVSLVASGPDRSFFYEKPSAELLARGVQPGALLFRGKKDGNQYTGMAYALGGKCKLPYPVLGEVTLDQRQVILRGKAPNVTAACSASGYQEVVLVLSFSEAAR